MVKEITPLLGPYGKIVPLPASYQVQVTDTAGVMRSVEVIQSIVEPLSPSAAAAPLVLARYPIKPADPETVQATFKALFPITSKSLPMTNRAVNCTSTPPQAEQTIAKKLIG